MLTIPMFGQILGRITRLNKLHGVSGHIKYGHVFLMSTIAVRCNNGRSKGKLFTENKTRTYCPAYDLNKSSGPTRPACCCFILLRADIFQCLRSEGTLKDASPQTERRNQPWGYLLIRTPLQELRQ
jgi:hypothetical protein